MQCSRFSVPLSGDLPLPLCRFLYCALCSLGTNSRAIQSEACISELSSSVMVITVSKCFVK